MERIYIRILGLFFLFVACSDYDDIAQWNMLQTHDVRISELESMCQRINTNIVSLKEVVNAVETNRTISQVLPLMDGSTQIGYTIMFSDGAIITLYNGRDGQDGKDGVDGEDGHTPSISVTRIEGNYYWTLDGEIIKGEDGKYLRVTGENGKDGKDGVNGNDGLSPQFRIVEGEWGVSYDNGKTWATLGQATGNTGNTGANGITPKFQIVDGKWQVSYDDEKTWVTLGDAVGATGGNGKDGVTPQFRIVDGKWDISYDNGKTWATLGQATGNTGNIGANGITPKFQIVDGKWQVSYDAEKTWVTLGDAVGATGGNGKDGVTPQFRIVDGKWDISYDNGKTWTTLGQATGNTGNIGANGITPKFQIVDGKWQVSYDDEKTWVTLGDAVGATGGNGKDGVTPQFRIVDGKWDISYDNGKTWTTLGQATGNTGNIGANGITPKFQIVDSKWQVSYDDEKTWVTLGDAVGATGGNGKDGVTPQLKIGEDGYWYVSYDNKKTWTNMEVKASGEKGKDGDSYFKNVTYDDNYVYITFNNEEVITIPMKESYIIDNFVTDGALPGVFSISEDKDVYFSRGNLQYNSRSDVWRFAEHQYDFVGLEGNSNRWNDTYDGWIDLFCWGTGNKPLSKYRTSFVDWGNNPISNGGNVANQWRTLTKSEWEYLIGHHDKGFARINGIYGLVLLPKEWYSGSQVECNFIVHHGGQNDYYCNSLTLSLWQKMEANGAVFLPIVGYYRNLNGKFTSSSDVGYWTSTKAYYYKFKYDNPFSIYMWDSSSEDTEMYCVRLAKDL